jgi:hypothetical protein
MYAIRPEWSHREYALIQNGGVIRDCEAMATPENLKKSGLDGRCLPERTCKLQVSNNERLDFINPLKADFSFA